MTGARVSPRLACLLLDGLALGACTSADGASGPAAQIRGSTSSRSDGARAPSSASDSQTASSSTALVGATLVDGTGAPPVGYRLMLDNLRRVRLPRMVLP